MEKRKWPKVLAICLACVAAIGALGAALNRKITM